MKLNKYSEQENNIKQREKEWLKENKEAIGKQNERMKKYGSFSDAYRRF